MVCQTIQFHFVDRHTLSWSLWPPYSVILFGKRDCTQCTRSPDCYQSHLPSYLLRSRSNQSSPYYRPCGLNCRCCNSRNPWLLGLLLPLKWTQIPPFCRCVVISTIQTKSTWWEYRGSSKSGYHYKELEEGDEFYNKAMIYWRILKVQKHNWSWKQLQQFTIQF